MTGSPGAPGQRHRRQPVPAAGSASPGIPRTGIGAVSGVGPGVCRSCVEALTGSLVRMDITPNPDSAPHADAACADSAPRPDTAPHADAAYADSAPRPHTAPHADAAYADSARQGGYGYQGTAGYPPFAGARPNGGFQRPTGPIQRLRRIREGRILGGVCTGFAEYAGFDPVVVRLVLVLAVLLGFGGAILVYLLAWLLIPREGAPYSRLDRYVSKQRTA